MALHLLDVFAIEVDGESKLVFDVDTGIGPIETYTISVVPDRRHEGDVIICIPADVWEKVPVDTVAEPVSDIGSLAWLNDEPFDDDEYEDGADDSTPDNAFGYGGSD